MDAEPTAETTQEREAPSEPTEIATPPSSGRLWAAGIGIMAMLIVGVLVVSQLRLIDSLDETRSDMQALESQIGAVGDSVDDLTDDVADVSADIAAAGAGSPSVSAGGSSPLTAPSNAAPAGYLPRYDSQTADQAIGMTLGTIEGVDGYSAEQTSVDPTDGTNRIWMIWAHWCPFCQQELPELSDWYPTVQGQYSTELVTISTSISPERGNPLETYLEEEQFPFPVIVDLDSSLAIQTGVSAFPFWMVTNGDGEVLLRATGLLHLDQVVSLFDQLESLES